MLDHVILGRDCFYSFTTDEVHNAPDGEDGVGAVEEEE
jgi:hypothetical protein